MRSTAHLARIIRSPANCGSTMRHTIYPGSYTRNLSPLVNFIYQIRSDILFSTEYRYMKINGARQRLGQRQSDQSEPGVYFLVRRFEQMRRIMILASRLLRGLRLAGADGPAARHGQGGNRKSAGGEKAVGCQGSRRCVEYRDLAYAALAAEGSGSSGFVRPSRAANRANQQEFRSARPGHSGGNAGPISQQDPSCTMFSRCSTASDLTLDFTRRGPARRFISTVPA